jgi:uncharacterized protein with HEPN domain
VTRSDRELLADASSHLEVLRDHQARRDLDDQSVADAVCLRLAAAIEAVANITVDVRARAFGTDWPLIRATRNRIAHGYTFIDRAMIAATIDNGLPAFEAMIRRVLAEWHRASNQRGSGIPAFA